MQQPPQSSQEGVVGSQESKQDKNTTLITGTEARSGETGVPAKRDHEGTAVLGATAEDVGSAVAADEDLEAAVTGLSNLAEASSKDASKMEGPPKRAKREWLAFHGVKHTRVGTDFQVAALPPIEAEATKPNLEHFPTKDKN
ncbi:MAG: hypothetical protein SGARI_007893 [Bacillariaceae sp.]